MGLGDGVFDDRAIYHATDLKVGLFTSTDGFSSKAFGKKGIGMRRVVITGLGITSCSDSKQIPTESLDEVAQVLKQINVWWNLGCVAKSQDQLILIFRTYR